jgi:hypothetical protein
MRLRSTAAVIVLATAVTLPLTGTALAADTDCADYPNQAAAQVVLAADPSDPNRLDGNDNGVACEDHTYGTAAASSTSTGGQVTARPAGAVAAGDGSGVTAVAQPAESPAPYVLGELAFSAAAGASFAARRARTRA